MSVSPSTVTRWKRTRSFWDLVEDNKVCWGAVLRDDYFEQIKAAISQATDAECFRRAFQMYVESIPQRLAALPTTQSLEKQRDYIAASRERRRNRKRPAQLLDRDS
jgi:hypothetical protein